MAWKLAQGHTAQAIYGARFDKGVKYTTWRPRGSGDLLLLFTVGGGGLAGNRECQRPVRAGDVVLFEQNA